MGLGGCKKTESVVAETVDRGLCNFAPSWGDWSVDGRHGGYGHPLLPGLRDVLVEKANMVARKRAPQGGQRAVWGTEEGWTRRTWLVLQALPGDLLLCSCLPDLLPYCLHWSMMRCVTSVGRMHPTTFSGATSIPQLLSLCRAHGVVIPLTWTRYGHRITTQICKIFCFLQAKKAR